MKVLITTSTFDKYNLGLIEKMRSRGIETVKNPYGRKLTPEEVFKFYLPDIDGVIAGTEKVSREVFSQAKSLKVISRCGMGVDGIDLDAAGEKGIKIFRTIDPVIDAVSELTVGLILSSLRKISKVDRDIREGKWVKPFGTLLKGKILGVVGLGNIGKKVVELLSGFSVSFVAFDINKDEDFSSKFSVKYVGLDELLAQADIVSLHLPAVKDTLDLIDSEKLSIMKKDALLVNTSRGGIINEEDLFAALKKKTIASCALDVFSKEPYNGPLKKLENALLTSHIGSYAKEARIAMEIQAVDNLLKELNYV